MESLNWLTVSEKYELFSLRLIFKSIYNHSTLSNSFSPYFTKIECNDRELRNCNNFKTLSMETQYGKASFSYQFVTAWNNLPTTMKTTKLYTKFDYDLRQLLLKHRDNNHIFPKTRIVYQPIKY